MNKLPPGNKFFDISDYSRPISKLIVRFVKNTRISPIHFTTLALFTGLIVSWFILKSDKLYIPAFLILLKSLFDAVDGELARARNRPSYVGRFYDSVVDFFVNVFIFYGIVKRSNSSILSFLIVIFLFHLQGSVYNYYSVIKRIKSGGDKTSRINEKEDLIPYLWDNKFWLTIFHKLYVIIYGWQDSLICKMDSEAKSLKDLPKVFMTLVSFLGLGTQLMIISILLVFNLVEWIIPFFIYIYTILALLIILIRKLLIK